MTVSISGTNGVTFPDSSLQTAAASPYVLKNRIINGDMRIDQRNAGASTTLTANTYTLDRWKAYTYTSSKFSVQQNAGSATLPAGYTNYLGVTSLSSYSVTSSDYYFLSQPIEGYNVSDLAWGTASAKTITLSFLVYSSLTGTFGGSISNNANTRSYPFTYTISSANTWTTVSITIAGDTNAAWASGSNTTNGIGMYLCFGLGMGSTYSGTAGSWASAAYYSATGATSVVGTNGATFYITGVQLEVGSTATPFERRLYNQELANCQRYYEQINGSGNASAFGSGTAFSTTAARIFIPFAILKRTSPTLTFSSASNFLTQYGGGTSTPSAISSVGTAIQNCYISTTGTYTQGYAIVLLDNVTTSAYIAASAEL